MRYFFLILFFGFDLPGFSQTEAITYNGKIVDASTEEPIPYVLLSLKKSPIGNVTNGEGEFLIKIPKSALNDTLVFSHIGYTNLELPLKSQQNTQLGILKLEPASMQLESVEVTAKRLSVEEIMNLVRKNRKKNFATNPFKLEGYYKHKLKVNGEEQAFIEVALDMIDEDFQPYKYKNGIAKEQIVLKGIRKNKAYDDEHAAIMKAMPTHDFLNNMLIINRARRGTEHLTLQYKIDTVTYYQGNLTYVILATLKDLEPDASFWKIKIYVDSDNYAILRYESLMDIKRYGVKTFDQVLNDSIKNKAVKLKRIIDFRKQGDHYYPFYYQMSGSDIVENIETGKEKLYEYSNELLLFNLSFNDIQKTKSTRTKAKLIDEKFDELDFDPVFWENYNYLQLTDHEIDKNFISDFNGKIKLEKDYQRSFSKGDTLLGSWNDLRSSYDVKHYNIDIDVDPVTETVKGKVVFDFRVLNGTSKIQFDLNKQLKINSIRWHSQNLAFTREFNAVFVDFRETLKIGGHHRLEIEYGGTPLKPNLSIPQYGAFFWTKDQENNDWFQSICQGSGANGWWPTKDHFLDKADSVDLIVTVPNEGELIANGKLVSKTSVSDNKVKYHWKIGYPILSYNIAINYGQYQEIKSDKGNEGFDVKLYKLKSSTDVGEDDLRNIENIVKVYENFFGSYPFRNEGLKVVETPYPMEHQGCIAIGANYDQELITHEIAHEWWGNSVTCTDYAELWIHESFATYAESLFIEATEGYEAGQAYLVKKKGLVLNKRPLIGNHGVNHIHYDIGDLYNKGALVLNTLRHAISDDTLWFDAIKKLQQSFRNKYLTTDEVVDFFSSAFDQNLDSFFDVYLNKKDLPELEVKLMEDSKGTLIKYRWNEEHFVLPIKIITQNKEQISLRAKNTWQDSYFKGLKASDIKIDQRSYLFKLVSK